MSEWISVKDRLPEDFVIVIGHMTDAWNLPAERECYCIGVGERFYFPALGGFHSISHWMEFPEPPKEDNHE